MSDERMTLNNFKEILNGLFRTGVQDVNRFAWTEKPTIQHTIKCECNLTFKGQYLINNIKPFRVIRLYNGTCNQEGYLHFPAEQSSGLVWQWADFELKKESNGIFLMIKKSGVYSDSNFIATRGGGPSEILKNIICFDKAKLSFLFENINIFDSFLS